jgi:hypothetical protein
MSVDPEAPVEAPGDGDTAATAVATTPGAAAVTVATAGDAPATAVAAAGDAPATAVATGEAAATAVAAAGEAAPTTWVATAWAVGAVGAAPGAQATNASKALVDANMLSQPSRDRVRVTRVYIALKVEPPANDAFPGWTRTERATS